MSVAIIGDFDKDTLYCAGSFTKLLTTFIALSLLVEKYDLNSILDDDDFLDSICHNRKSKDFLHLFQKTIGSRFTIRDLCSFYTGLPYTFDLAADEMLSVEDGNPFKHHAVPDEKSFLKRCHEDITTIFPNRGKFHYSEIAIIFLGYLMEKVFQVRIEDLFQRFVIDKFQLSASQFARKRPANVYTQDLSPAYDYPSIAILDHGYFCYSNGFYTTLNNMKNLLENLFQEPVFQFMVDVKKARAASNRLLNGLTIEMRLVGDDLVYGYEGLSFSGCNIWAYSTKLKQGYLTFVNSEEDAYKIIYDQALKYTEFDKVPDDSQKIYSHFLKDYHFTDTTRDIPHAYQGRYRRVRINASELDMVFEIGKNYIVIRNPDEVKYATMYVNNHYHIKGKDNVQGTTVNLYEAPSGNRYMLFDGTLYQKII
jgi:CubicO group peptidase (beta-lactamase class C family)